MRRVFLYDKFREPFRDFTAQTIQFACRYNETAVYFRIYFATRNNRVAKL